MKRKEPHGRKDNAVAVAPNEDSYQPGKLHSVKRIVALHSLDQTGWKYRPV